MKKALVWLVALLPAVAWAQNNPQDQARTATDRMKEAVALTPEQEGQAYEANLAFFTSVQGVSDPEAQRDVRRQAAQVREARMKEILTPEQYQTLQKQRKHKRSRMKNQKGGGMDPTPLQPED